MTASDAPSPLDFPGATATSPLGMPPAAWKQILGRAWAMSGIHRLSLISGGVAFFAFLSLTPLITATVILYGLTGSVEAVQQQMQTIEAIAPGDVATIINRQLNAAVTTNSGAAGIALAVAFLFALYGGSYAVSGMIGALNTINEEEETRGYFRPMLRAAIITLLAIATGLLAIVTAAALAWLQARAAFLGSAAETVLSVCVWLAIVGFGSAGFALIMRYSPDRRPAKWRWIVPGALLALLLWVAISGGFSLYVAYIYDYNAVYGSLSAFVIFVMWLYLSSYVLLLGALIHAETERQTLADSTVGPGRPIGSRGAVLADSHVAQGLARLRDKRGRSHGAGVQPS